MVNAPESPTLPPRDHDEAPPDYRPSARSASGPPARNTSLALGTEHRYALETKGRAWMTLRVASRAGDAKGLPLFVDGDEIRGTVQLDLDKAESVKGIAIAVGGSVGWVGGC